MKKVDKVTGVVHDITWECCNCSWHRVIDLNFGYSVDPLKWNPVCPICDQVVNPDYSELDSGSIKEFNEIFGS